MVTDLDVRELIRVVSVHCVHHLARTVAFLVGVDELVLSRVHVFALYEVGAANLDAAAVNSDLLSTSDALPLL